MIPFLDIRKITQQFQPALGEAVNKVIDSGLFVRSASVEQFETAYAAFTGSRHCVGVGNGFDALRLILRSWIIAGDLREEDEVIVPANTYIASILAVKENRLCPVLVEPDPKTFNMDVSRIEEAITERTRAVMVVHLYGRNAMSEEISRLAKKHSLKIIEDNAQAAGCLWNGRRTGSVGDAAAHSFFPTKNLGALGDGGAVTTDDVRIAGIVRTLGNYGSHSKGVNDLPGVNSRLDEIQAAVLYVKLPTLDRDNDRRRKIADYYLSNIRNSLVSLPQPPVDGREHVWHLFVARCRERDLLQAYMRDRGVETLVHYPIPPHHQQALREMNDLRFPITEEIHREVISLPLNPALDEGDVRRIVDVVNGFEAGR